MSSTILLPPRAQLCIRYCSNKQQLLFLKCVMGRLVHTGLGSSSHVAHVLQFPLPPRAQLCTRSCSNKHTHCSYKHTHCSPPREPRGQHCNRYCSNKHTREQLCNRYWYCSNKYTHCLVRDGQTSPHRPRLVVSRSTCPPLSPFLHANSFIIGTAVINTLAKFSHSDTLGTAVINTTLSDTIS
jgi:hypothetical protein